MLAALFSAFPVLFQAMFQNVSMFQYETLLKHIRV